MARQPAVHLRPPLPVAFDAETHLEIDRKEPVQRLYLSMTFGAVEFGPLDMGNVAEEYKIRDPVNADPGHRLSLVKMLLFLHDLGMLGNDVLVAVETLLHGGNPGVGRALHPGMAEPAGDLLHPRMDPVTEVDGLLGADIPSWIEIIKVSHGGKEEGQNPQP